MSARYDLLAVVSFNDAVNAGSTPEELVDAYRAEVLAEIADKLVLELSADRPPMIGYSLALTTTVRMVRSMSDEAATR